MDYFVNDKKKEVGEFYCCVLEHSDTKQLVHKFKAAKHSKFVLIGGQPLNEPIEQYGPFVMTNKQEIYQAFEDYQGAKNGFEGREHWESKIQYLAEGKKIE